MIDWESSELSSSHTHLSSEQLISVCKNNGDLLQWQVQNLPGLLHLSPSFVGELEARDQATENSVTLHELFAGKW